MLSFDWVRDCLRTGLRLREGGYEIGRGWTVDEEAVEILIRPDKG